MIAAFVRSMQKHICSRYFAALFCIYLLGIFSLVRANRSYLDDVGRALYGYADWVAAARPLAELLSWVFYLGPKTVDASPFTQILAVGFLAVSSLLLLNAMRVRVTWSSVLCTVPVGLSPYGLENLSYKFDSPWMALALLLAVLPCCFFHTRPWIRTLFAAVCLFCAASLYQPALGGYICIAVYVILTELVSRRSLKAVLDRTLQFLLPFCLGVGIYAAQASFWIARSQYTDYVSQHITVPPLSEMPFEVMENISTYVHLLVQDWGHNGFGVLFGVLFACFVLQLFVRFLRSTRLTGAHWSGAARLVLTLLLLPCFLLAPFGIQFFLSSPVWAPRTFQGFGIMVALIVLSLHAGTRRGKVLRRFAVAMQALVLVQLLIFANVYGNLLDAQNQWELSRISLLALDLNRFIKETGSSRVSFVGSVGLSPLAVRPAQKYPLLRRLVTVPLTRDWRWGYEQLNTFGVQIERQPPPESLSPDMLTPFIETPSYRIERTPEELGIVTFLAPPVPRATKKKSEPGK